MEWRIFCARLSSTLAAASAALSHIGLQSLSFLSSDLCVTEDGAKSLTCTRRVKHHTTRGLIVSETKKNHRKWHKVPDDCSPAQAPSMYEMLQVRTIECATRRLLRSDQGTAKAEHTCTPRMTDQRKQKVCRAGYYPEKSNDQRKDG